MTNGASTILRSDHFRPTYIFTFLPVQESVDCPIIGYEKPSEEDQPFLKVGAFPSVLREREGGGGGGEKERERERERGHGGESARSHDCLSAK